MIRKLLVVALGTFLISTAAMAGNAYVGASVGQTTFKVSDTSFDFNSDDSGYKIFGGYRFLKFFGVEGSYVDLGSPTDNVGGGEEVKISATGWDAFAVGVLPFGGLFEIFGKAGFIKWNADTDISGAISGSDSSDGRDPAYGLGFMFHLGKIFGVRAEYERYKIEDTDNVYTASVGAEIRF